ncbi:hypothetical protein NE237_026655 [Protea cynaroides]|uniref:Uncharacterized protein n=1 Tax=Protea cynaroides TaxID=273540 RepID=A0A9Q0H9D1_9MAGN|nr:hypothetical protein NE237_026655 [Protea cynaroides]
MTMFRWLLSLSLISLFLFTEFIAISAHGVAFIPLRHRNFSVRAQLGKKGTNLKSLVTVVAGSDRGGAKALQAGRKLRIYMKRRGGRLPGMVPAARTRHSFAFRTSVSSLHVYCLIGSFILIHVFLR